MPTYPPPEDNPECICEFTMQAFFCPTGHVLECHYPMPCDEAECSHWERPREVESWETEEPL